MKPRLIIVGMFVVVIVVVVLLRRTKPQAGLEQPASAPTVQSHQDQPNPARRLNDLGDILTDAQDPVFVNQVFPKFHEFVATLNRLGINPFESEVQPASCSKIRIIHTPNGIICPFVIGDGWTADYTQNGSFSGITHFGQRGPDNPFRAISRADTDALNRLSQRAIAMPEVAAWPIADRVADAFGIDRSRFEKPQMHEEALFEYRLGMQTVRYRVKSSDPLNQMNYTLSFTLKATSPTTAVLVRYSNLVAR